MKIKHLLCLKSVFLGIISKKDVLIVPNLYPADGFRTSGIVVSFVLCFMLFYSPYS